MPKIRTRFAPSPTGVPHIGSIRTALFNYLYAKHQKGDFILRIEDTDQKRSTKEYIGDIKKSLKLLNINWDEDYLQSNRLDLYQKHLDILKKKDQVYKDDGAWRLKITNQNQDISWKDSVHGNVSFSANLMEDFVIIKSDGYPTYHFASVVDDHEMLISHVIRGDEWISSTPKHLLLYKALKFHPPQFCHVPVVLGEDHKKLSKREGAKSVGDYIAEGYLPEAVINFLVLLGWAPKSDNELYTLQNLIKEFTLERLNKNSPIFNIKKLNWFNKKYIQKLSNKELSNKTKSLSIQLNQLEDKTLSAILELTKDRAATLKDFESFSKIFLQKGDQKPPEKSKILLAVKAINEITKWDLKSITNSLDKFVRINNLNPADFKNTLRLSVFAANTPPIYESLAVLTKKEVQSRIQNALE